MLSVPASLWNAWSLVAVRVAMGLAQGVLFPCINPMLIRLVIQISTVLLGYCHKWVIVRVVRNLGVGQCLGFCTDYFWYSLPYSRIPDTSGYCGSFSFKDTFISSKIAFTTVKSPDIMLQSVIMTLLPFPISVTISRSKE